MQPDGNRSCAAPRQAVIVTGATGGIGSALLRNLYAGGQYVVIAACRAPGRLDPLVANLRTCYPRSVARIIPAHLDLSTVANARTGAYAIRDLIQEEGLSLYGIINNAGTMPVNHLEVSPDGMEMSLQVNCISTLTFTLALLPLVERGGVVVMTSSVMRHFPTLRDDFAGKALKATNMIQRFNNYGRSKLLLTHAAKYLSEALDRRGIRVNCADPGVVDSGIITLGYPVVDKIADIIARPLMSSPDSGAAAALLAMSTFFTGRMASSRSLSPLPPLTSWQRNVVETALRMATP